MVRKHAGYVLGVASSGGTALREQKVQDVLGRLPSRYRLTIWVLGLVAFTGVGAWLALTTGLPLRGSSGAAVGAALGVLVVAGYLHVLEHSSGTARPADRSR